MLAALVGFVDDNFLSAPILLGGGP